MPLLPNLRALRVRADLSQKDLADRLGVSQSQLSRYEENPANVPFEKVMIWLEACGVTFETALREASDIEAETAWRTGLDIGDPYVAFRSRLDLLTQYVKAAAPSLDGVPVEFDPDGLVRKIDEWRKKPTLMIAGRFDSGKTKLANTLLGGNLLPSQWTPTTSVITFIRHEDDRPAFQKEEVWLMNSVFDPAMWADPVECPKNKVLAGSFDTLRRFGTIRPAEVDGGGGTIAGTDHRDVKWALVYMKAPVLRSCTLVDLPGYEDDEAQDVLTKSIASGADVLIYAAPSNNFLDIRDRHSLGMFLRLLLPQKTSGDYSLSLRRLIIVATHANVARFSDETMRTIMDRGSERMFSTLEGMLELRTDGKLTANELRGRMFTFWYEEVRRREQLEQELATILGSLMPKLIETQVESQIKEIKIDSKNHFAGQIVAYERALEEIQSAKGKLVELLNERPLFVNRIKSSQEQVQAKIAGYAKATREHIDAVISPMLGPDHIEAFILKNYGKGDDNEKRTEAKTDAMGKLVESVQAEVERRISDQMNELETTVEDFLKQFSQYRLEHEMDLGSMTLSIPYDVRAAFFGGVGGLGIGGIGGLMVASKIGLLSAVGVGSTAVLALSAIGLGPIALIVGLSAFASLGIWAMVKTPWQERLAKKIAKTLDDAKMLEKLRVASDSHWESARKSFTVGAERVQANFGEYIDRLTTLVDARDRTTVENTIKKLEELKIFFAGIPWKSSH